MIPQDKNEDISSTILYDKALEALNSVSLEEAFILTGLKFSYLKKFRSGKIKNPSVQKVERILVAINGKATTE